MITGVYTHRMLYYGLFDTGRHLWFKDPQKTDMFLFYGFAATVSAFSSVVLYPFDLIRRRLIVQQGRSNKLFNTAVDCAKHTFIHEGYQGFYRGFTVSVAKNTSSSLMAAWLQKNYMNTNIE